MGFSAKICYDGSLDRYKVCFVALDSRQEYGIDYKETFSPVAKMVTVRTVLAIVASQSWRLHQIDLKERFSSLQSSQGHLYETSIRYDYYLSLGCL